MIYAYKKSANKVVHTTNCIYKVNSNSKKIIIFSSMKEAVQKGYRMCKKCNPLKNDYEKHKKQIIGFAKSKKLKLEYLEKEIKIKSCYGQWKIVVCYDGYGISLYHKNTENRYNDNYVPNYHCQNVEKSSIIRYLDYIVKHDECMKKNQFKQEAMIRKQKRYMPKTKNKKETVKPENDNNALQILQRLYKEEVYKNFLCYIT